MKKNGVVLSTFHNYSKIKGRAVQNKVAVLMAKRPHLWHPWHRSC